MAKTSADVITMLPEFANATTHPPTTIDAWVKPQQNAGTPSDCRYALTSRWVIGLRISAKRAISCLTPCEQSQLGSAARLRPGLRLQYEMHDGRRPEHGSADVEVNKRSDVWSKTRLLLKYPL
jgi:hypothetical protein